MRPLRFVRLNNRYEFALEHEVPAFDRDRLAACRAAMIGAIGCGRGQLIADGRSFVVRRLATAAAPAQGGAWTIDGRDQPDMIRFAVCRDANAEQRIWRAVHAGWSLIVSRPVNAPPALPWCAVAAVDFLTTWGGASVEPFPHSPVYLGVAWWDLFEAGALGY